MDFSRIAPAAFRAVFGVESYAQSQVDHTLLHLIKVRASMVNECSFCVDMHTIDALKDGETTHNAGFLDGFDAATGVPVLHRPMAADLGGATLALTSAGISVARSTVFVAASTGAPPDQAGWVIAYRP